MAQLLKARLTTKSKWLHNRIILKVQRIAWTTIISVIWKLKQWCKYWSHGYLVLPWSQAHIIVSQSLLPPLQWAWILYISCLTSQSQPGLCSYWSLEPLKNFSFVHLSHLSSSVSSATWNPLAAPSFHLLTSLHTRLTEPCHSREHSALLLSSLSLSFPFAFVNKHRLNLTICSSFACVPLDRDGEKHANKSHL